MPPVALITGGARGIGLGISRQLAAAGWSLMLNGVRPKENVADVLNDLEACGADVDYHSADVGSASGRQDLIAAVRDRFGRLDALVNNAGITSPGRKDILEAEEADFDHVIGINLKGPFFLTQEAVKLMRESVGSGAEGESGENPARKSVVFVSSVSAEFVSTNRGDYCISKAAIGMTTQLWAVRLAEFGIDVFEVRPGVIRSDMTAGVTEKYDRLIAEGLTLERRWGKPDDVGRAVRTLLDGGIPYATGQVLKIDGGMTVRVL
jgi:3-oxoacyl-[acyl-carrier protein] reductase